MKRRHLVFLAVPMLGLLLFIGCTSSSDTGDNLFPPSNTGEQVARQPLQSDGMATIKGTVTFDGDPPPMPIVAGIDAHKDKGFCCTKGCPHEETWMVDPATKGVANVVVWVSCPNGKYFPMDDYFKEGGKLKKFWPDN
ncbi:MAG TPA: hypothetical protein VGZ47_13880, partial [Gemmataceae bacterium]|nr:hypothetical protein [Gemmataceae bacterium]